MHNAQAITFAPQDVSRLTIQEIERRSTAKGEGVRLYVDALDRIVNPMRPGELITILARPGNWKTSMGLWIARNEAKTIYKAREMGVSGAFGDAVVYVTWEIAVEEAGLLDLSNNTKLDIAKIARGEISDEQWKLLKGGAARRAGFPLWVMGYSLENRKEMPTLRLSDVQDALIWMEDDLKIKADLVVLDYLQAMSQDQNNRQQRRQQIDNDLKDCKGLSRNVGAPVVLQVQAKREVDEREYKVPLQGDGHESSGIEHWSDKIIPLMYPRKYYQPGASVEIAGQQFICDTDVLVVSVEKQRYGPIGGPFVLKVDPTTNSVLGEMKGVREKFENAQEAAWTQPNLQ